MPERGAQPEYNRVAFSFPAVADSISEVRHLIISEARMLPFTTDELDDIALAISEVFTNLVQYAPGYRIRGECSTNSGKLDVRFEVEQNISQFLRQRQFPAGLSHSGRGIPLVNLLIPTVEVNQRADGGWELHLVKPISRKEPG